jgi:hypothetical protein
MDNPRNKRKESFIHDILEPSQLESPMVIPQNPPRNAITLGFRECQRASLNAVSIASEQVSVK